MIINRYSQLASTPSDIYEHLPILVKYAQHCSHVTELGVRNIVSTWAWLEAKVGTIRCYDIVQPPEKALLEVETFAKQENLDFQFIQADVLKVKLDPTELLFIDTWHVYTQLKQELLLHSSAASKYIILHDTALYAHQGEDGSPLGLQDALNEWLLTTDEWQIKQSYTNNNGLTILERV